MCSLAPGTQFEDIYRYEAGKEVEVWFIEDSDVSKSGYKLDGWRNNVTGAIHQYGDTFVMPDSHAILTAVRVIDS